ncbi:MAG: PVC-type heme-binding CxxCH protein, partial [Pirellulales bacterium]
MLAPIARPVLRIVAIGVLATIGHTTTAAESVDSDRGILPLGAEGRPLNFDFETGTLDDWTVRGEAFQDQPVEGDTVATRRGDMKSRHTGKFWIGGFERKGDAPHGTLTSVPFRVTHPFASFRIGGGQLNATRVELVGKETGEVFFRASGGNLEDMHPVVVDLGGQQGKEIFIRLVDAHGGGWGHVNFDDFRFHQQRPEFPDAIKMASVVDQYPYGDLSPADAARVMKLPSGFSVTAFAGEPEVRQPIAMAIDDRGRLWVAEAYEYPRRAPDGKGRDRILILEDTDGDGVHDRRTVFQEHLNLVSGLEVGFGGVWVGAAPTLLFIPDADGDDQPDGPPQVLLDGWAYQDTHETLNAFIWGPDGWLYGCHGVFTHSRVGKPGTPEEQRIPLNGAIWRYHPTRHTFEVFAHGTSNPWGVDFDDHGQAFCTACVIPHLFHVIQGARYRRQAGGHFNPYTYDDIKTIADHRHYAGAVPHAANNRSDSAGGGHAHAGAMIYLGNTWPAPYRGKIFMNNIHGQRINMDVLEPAGSGFVGSHGPDFLFTGDRWSQIVNLRYGPDGQVLMIDWYDQQACHTGNISDHDRGNGRVFQVRYGDGKSSPIDLKQKSDRELVKLQLHANDWFVRHARRILAERAAAGKLDPNARHDLLTMARSNPDAARRLRAMWALHVTGRLPADLVPALLVDESPYVRGWTIQLVLEAPAPHPPEELLREFADMARHDPSPVVRLYLASAAQRIDLENRWGIVEGLLTHAEDAHDHNLPLMIWYALEPLAGHDPARALALALGAEDAFPQLREFVVRRIASGEGGEPIELLVTAMAKSKRPDQVRTLMAGLHAALRGQRDVAAPPLWAEVYRQLAANGEPDLRFQATLLGAVFGDRQAMAALRQVAGDPQAKQADRQRAVRTLLTARDPKLVAVLQTLLHDTRLLSTAIKGLAAYNDAETPRRILAVYATLAPQQRREALATFAARPSYAMALLDAVEKKQIAASDLTADLIRQLRNLGDQRLNDRITEVWGTVRNTTKERAETIATIKAMLERRGKRAPDPMLGRALFAKTCQQCH